MKKNILSSIFSFILSICLFAQTNEGTFTMVMKYATRSENNMSADYFLKNDKLLEQMNMQGTKITVIVDSKEKSLYTIMGEEKTAFRTSFPNDSMTQKKYSKPVYTETEEKKVIEGYHCHKIMVWSAEGTSEIWVTNEVDLDINMMAMAKSVSFTMPTGWGFPIQVNLIDNGEKVTITYKNIKKQKVDPKMFDLTRYEIIERPVINLDQH